MPIIHMMRTGAPVPEGAVNVRVLKDHPEITLYDSHVGACISDREMNGRDDSDWYMLVWDEAAGEPKEILFATTRGWSYPCYGSSPDATPEVLAKYEAWKAERAAEIEAGRARVEAVTPTKGKRVRVTRGNPRSKAGFATGAEGTVFWSKIESRGFFDAKDHYWTPKGRVGIELPDGYRGFINAGAVEVVSA